MSIKPRYKQELTLFLQNFINLINEDAEKYKLRQSQFKELTLPNLKENWVMSANRRSQLSKQLKEYTKRKNLELKTQLILNATKVVNNLTSNNPSRDLVDALTTSTPDELQLYFGSNVKNIERTLYNSSNNLLNAMVHSANQRNNGASIGDILTGALAVPVVGGLAAGASTAASRGLTKPIGNMLAGMLAGETINYGAEQMGYGSFGGFAGLMAGTNPEYNWAWEFTNPGYIAAPFSESNKLLTATKAYDLTKPIGNQFLNRTIDALPHNRFINNTIRYPYLNKVISNEMNRNLGINPRVPLTTLANEYSKEMFNIDWNATPYYIPSKVRNGASTVSNIIDNNGFAVVRNDKNYTNLNWVSLTNPRSWRKNRSFMTLMNGDNGAFIHYVNSIKPGEGRKLYDAAIINARRLGLPGIITGTDLYSAPKTLSMLEHHYPEKEILHNNGSWDNANMITFDPFKKSIRLTNPTPQEYLLAVNNNPGYRVWGTNAPTYLLQNPSRNRTIFGLGPLVEPLTNTIKSIKEISNPESKHLFTDELLPHRGDMIFNYTPGINNKSSYALNSTSKNNLLESSEEETTEQEFKRLFAPIFNEENPIFINNLGENSSKGGIGVKLNNLTAYPVDLAIYENYILPTIRKRYPEFAYYKFDDTVYQILNGSTQAAIWHLHKPNTGGVHYPLLSQFGSRVNGTIILRRPNAAGHELRHRLDHIMEHDALFSRSQLYKDDFNYVKNLFGNEFFDMSDTPNIGRERITTLYDTRKELLRLLSPNNITKENIEKAINQADDASLLVALKNSNGYGYDYVDGITKKYTGIVDHDITENTVNAFKKKDPNFFNKLRKALLLPSLALPTMLINNNNNQ